MADVLRRMSCQEHSQNWHASTVVHCTHPGLQTTLSSAAVFGLFLGAGSLLHCGRSQGY